MNKLKVLGIGSPFGDDCLGWQTIKLLQQRPALDKFLPLALQMQECDRPGMRLLEFMRDTPTVILIDAVNSGRTLGTTYRLENLAILKFKPALSSHAIGVAEVLQIGLALQQLPEQLIFFGMEVSPDHKGQHLSAAVVQGLCHFIDSIEQEILQIFRKIAV